MTILLAFFSVGVARSDVLKSLCERVAFLPELSNFCEQKKFKQKQKCSWWRLARLKKKKKWRIE
jgi:hypothetical protein